MWWRIFYGFLRLIIFVLLHLINSPISDIFHLIMAHEVIEDPQDLLVGLVAPAIQGSSLTVTYFLAFYIILWGVIDIFLSINLLRQNLWAFSVGMYIISLLILYECYRLLHTHSIILALVIIVDIFWVFLIRKEYLKLKHGISLST